MTGEYSTLDFCFLFLFIKDRDKILIAKDDLINNLKIKSY